ncbi:flagellar protein FliT [Vibrio sp. JC009]|uniref:flagellar protein FliT n=1 Tax=Vibrio sp. JC009 TaxID=2912314 RepID=UPI0023AE98D2|nr:flagellar protein FliT [Vibrio sp. JC009]WED21070.1 flagellar protein FliT [Vibrio sp. JC009]
MADYLSELSDLDHNLLSQLQEDDLKAEEIILLVDKREQILQNIYEAQKSDPDFKNSSQWREALGRTKQIVELMQSKTNEIGGQLRKLRHGSKSVQRYQQFL